MGFPKLGSERGSVSVGRVFSLDVERWRLTLNAELLLTGSGERAEGLGEESQSGLPTVHNTTGAAAPSWCHWAGQGEWGVLGTTLLRKNASKGLKEQ